MFTVLEKYHQKLQNESSPRQITCFIKTRKISRTHYREKHYNPIEITHRCNSKTPATYKQKENPRIAIKMQLYLRPFYNILDNKIILNGQQYIKHDFKKSKKLLTEQMSNTIPDPNQPFYAMWDASNFGIGAALLQSHNGTNEMNLISANSRLFTQAELRLSILMKECTAIIYNLTEYELLILDSKHLTVLFTDHKPIIFLFTQKSNPNHKVYRFQFILMKFPNLHIVWTAGKNPALPDTLSRNTPPELLSRKTTVERPQKIKFYLAKDETSPRLESKYTVKTEIEQ